MGYERLAFTSKGKVRRTMAFRSDLEAVILSVLESGPQHGYAIVKQLIDTSDGLLKLGEGQLYPALHKLESMGMVEAEWLPQEGKPSRRIYKLTEAGRSELKLRRQSWSKFKSSIDAVMKVG
jgi:PadR family transcriptional regulator PadR